MHLVQILLPLADDRGAPFPAEDYAAVRDELVARFGGLTAYSRAPAKGFWQDGEEIVRDDVVVVEVMAETIDEAWWRGLRERLERRFAQDVVVVRAQAIRRL